MEDSNFRLKLGSYLVVGATVALTILAAIMIGAAALSTNPALLEVVRSTYSSLLPMFGTWVGTVLAFYFSRENFEAANRGTLDLVKAVGQRLGSIRVSEKMLGVSQVVKLKLAANQAMSSVAIADIERLFASEVAGKKISRLLVLNVDGACVAVIHRSLYMEALASALRSAAPLNPQTDAIQKLLSIGYPSPPPVTYEDFFRSTIAFVGRDRSLADAKVAMEAIPGCQDVVVTATGAKGEPMQGWLSNVDIGRASIA